MMQASARISLGSHAEQTAVEDTGTPTFERVLNVFEHDAGSEPFDPAHLKVLYKLQDSSKQHFGTILDRLLEGPDSGTLPPALIRGAQMLHRRLANALGQAALRLAHRPQSEEQQRSILELALLSLHARGEELKWHAFEQTAPEPSSWEHANFLMRALESLGLQREVLGIDATCNDAFAHCLLVATLNVGILTPPQMELAYRWLVAEAREMRVEPFFDPEAHWYQIDLARAAGPERISQVSAVADTTRFLAVMPLGPLLARARSLLYAGELSVGATPNRVVALHFGAFLDVAERLWSPDWRRASWRSDRVKADHETIDVVLGVDAVMHVLGLENADLQHPAVDSWQLRDKSATGLGALLPLEAGESISLGTLMAFRPSGSERWELASVVRRVRAPDASEWSIGIKRLSDAPLPVLLKALGSAGAVGETSEYPAIYAPINADGARINGVVVDAQHQPSSSEFLLPTRRGTFHIRANRVIDRGERWMRLGFEVLAKK
jgi:hypothetical protein